MCCTFSVLEMRLVIILKNITLKIDDRILTRVRHLAVDENKSVSAWVTELIERTLNETDEYEQERREALHDRR
jgi:hypothetical protein